MPYQSTQNYYYQPQTTQIRQPLIGLRGRPVSGSEEVRAAAVDFDGTVSFFPDLANGKIYTKQCNIDGTASLNMYEIKEIPVAPQPESLSNFIKILFFLICVMNAKDVVQQNEKCIWKAK